MRSHLTNGRYLMFSFFIYILRFHSVLSQDDELALDGRARSCRILRKPGTCVPIQDCDVFVRLLRQDPNVGRRVLYAARCSRRDLTVCCPQQDNDYESSSSEEQSQEMVSVTKSSYGPLQPPQCGYSNSPHDRVVGGNPAALGAWPWIANIGYGSGRRANFLCGGTLISSRHIVTAGHCVNGRRDLRFVRLGEHNLASDNDGADPIDIPVEKAILHPDFDEDTLENDIAILRLSRDVPFTDAIHPICLPISDDLRNRDFDRNYPFVAGWGATSFEGSTSNTLLEAQIPVVDNEQCKRAYRRVQDTVIDDRVLCAGYAQGGKDACQGDSGGPFMFPVKQTYYLIGVVSGGYRCAEPGFPGIYTRVTSFLDFIESNLN